VVLRRLASAPRSVVLQPLVARRCLVAALRSALWQPVGEGSAQVQRSPARLAPSRQRPLVEGLLALAGELAA
jgi:hypothetical protein